MILSNDDAGISNVVDFLLLFCVYTYRSVKQS